MRDYTKIDAWRLADDLTVAVYECTRTFPREEVYSLTNQIRHASYSVPANIAEGSSRESQRDYLHFLYMARGSLCETQYFLHLSRRLSYLAETDATRLTEQSRAAFACLHGLIKAVEKNAGKISKIVAAVTSLLVLSLFKFSHPLITHT